MAFPDEPAAERLYHDPEFVPFYDLHNRWDIVFGTYHRLGGRAGSVHFFPVLWG